MTTISAAASFAVTFIVAILGLLNDRLLIGLLDDDLPSAKMPLSRLIHMYGPHVTGVMYAAVEIVACWRFALLYGLQGPRAQLLPIIKRRGSLVLGLSTTCIISYGISVAHAILRTPIGALLVRQLSPLRVPLEACHSEMRKLFGDNCLQGGSDYVRLLFGRAWNYLCAIVGRALDTVALWSRRSIILRLFYLPIAMWFAVLLCMISVPLALLTPYAFAHCSTARPNSAIAILNVCAAAGTEISTQIEGTNESATTPADVDTTCPELSTPSLSLTSTCTTVNASQTPAVTSTMDTVAAPIIESTVNVHQATIVGGIVPGSTEASTQLDGAYLRKLENRAAHYADLKERAKLLMHGKAAMRWEGGAAQVTRDDEKENWDAGLGKPGPPPSPTGRAPIIMV